MMSNVKKKDVPLISISLVAILFIAAALSLFPQQSADAANAIYTFVTRTLGSAVQVLVLLALLPRLPAFSRKAHGENWLI